MNANKLQTTYDTRAHALKVLKEICVKCVKHAKEVLTEVEGKWVLDEDKLEELMTREEWNNVYGTGADEAESKEVKVIKADKAPKTKKTKIVKASPAELPDSTDLMEIELDKKCENKTVDEITGATAYSTPAMEVVQAVTEAVKVYNGNVFGFSEHGFENCPSCGTHLSNGVGVHGQEVNGLIIKHLNFEFACLGCGEEFGPEITTVVEKTKRVIKNHSSIEKPVEVSRRIIQAMKDSGNINRKECIAACVAVGVTYWTADQVHYKLCVKPIKDAKLAAETK